MGRPAPPGGKATRGPSAPTPRRARVAEGTAPEPRTRSLKALREAAADCKRCPLWRPATQTVFGEGPRRARILVVGDMGEVGAQGKEFHEEIGAYAQSKGIETVLATGELARHLAASGAQHYEQFDELLAALDSKLGGNAGAKCDVTVLVKGSRFMKMERVVQHLTGSTPIGKDAH